MIVFRKTMEAAVEAQRKIGAAAVMQLASSYGAALDRVTALQKQLSAWVLNDPKNITPEQMAQMFYMQDDEFQAAFFNCMQEQVRAYHDAQPPARPGQIAGYAGHPAGEGQWYHMAKHLDDEGFETIEAMLDHAKHHRENEAERAYDRHQENLMETGGGPTLQEQQIAALALKR